MNAYGIIRNFGVVVLLALGSVQCSKEKMVPGCFSHQIHKCMSPEEVQHVFRPDADSVPEYEVTKLHMPKRLHKRDLPLGSHIHTIAFGENINLWLHPTDSILAGKNTPVYYAKKSSSKPEGVEYRRQDGLMAMVGQIFEDPINMVSLVIGTEYTGRTRVNGFVESKRIAIRSLPRRVVDEYSRWRRSFDDQEDPQYSPYHVVIRMNETFKGNYSHSPVKKTRAQERLARSVKVVPDTLYPEVLVVLDNSAYHAFDTPQGPDIYGLLEYLLAFWNGVDLKYRSIDTPKFRFHISAIVLGLDVGATPYIKNSRINSKAFNVSAAGRSSRKFWYGVKDTFPLDSYDIAATMTRRHLGYSHRILGHSFGGSACRRSDTKKKVHAVTIYKDNGAFSGVYHAAHELGHIFGAHHDIGEDCPYQHGFFMSDRLLSTTNTSDMSSCSLEDVQKRLNDQKLTCLYNRPNEDGESLPRLMPGKMKNLEAQCRALKGGSSCQDEHPEHSVCVKMFCFNEKGECTYSKRAALDGTQCGSENDFCLHQRCVSL